MTEQERKRTMNKAKENGRKLRKKHRREELLERKYEIENVENTRRLKAKKAELVKRAKEVQKNRCVRKFKKR